MQNIQDRLYLLIDELADGKSTIFAKNAGIPPSTFQFYIKGRMPHGDHLIRIRKTYNVNTDWLLTGEGSIYIDKDHHPEDSGSGSQQEEQLNIPELRDMTTVVLESNTVYRAALAANVRAFYKAVKNEEEKMEMQEQLTRIEIKHEADMQELKQMIMGLAVAAPEKKSSAA